MMKFMHGATKRWGLWVIALMLFGGLVAGCACEEELPPPRPPAEIKVSPKNWTILEKDILIIGQKALPIYGKFQITNAAVKKLGQDPLTLKVESINIKNTNSSSKAKFKLITTECPKQFSSLTDEDKIKAGCQPTDCVVTSNNQRLCVKLPLSLPQELNPGDKPLEFVVEFTAAPDGIVPIANIEIASNTGVEDGETKTNVTKVQVSAQSGGAEIAVNVGPGKLKDASTRTRWGYSFPAKEEGKAVEQEFTVENSSQTNLEFSMNWQSGTEDPKKFFEVLDKDGKSALQQKYTIGPGQPAMTFKLRFTPKDCSDHATTLQISSNAISKDRGDGVLKSARNLYIDMRGGSPAQAAVDPNALVFDNVKPNTKLSKTFDISVGSQSLCTLRIYSLKFGPANAGDPAPKDFTFSKFTKAGQTVDAPTAGKPVTLSKGEKLTVEVTYSPKVAGGENASILLDSNDKNIGNPVVSLTGGTTSTIPPQAVIKFFAGEDDFKSGNDRYKKDEQLKQNEADLEVKKSMTVVVDGTGSFSVPKGAKKITAYKWEIVDKPRGSKATMTDSDKARASFRVDIGDPTGRSIYKIKLTVTDEDGLKGSKVVDFKVFGT